MKLQDLFEDSSYTFTLGNRSWDIRKGMEIVKRDNIQLETHNVSDLSSLLGFVKINKQHAETVDLQKPVLLGVVRMSGQEGVILLDGNHRVYKAKQEGITQLPAYVLELDQTAEIEL
jgi:hypothetical protein